jgi:2-phospho-L-lactate guanylyltransferase
VEAAVLVPVKSFRAAKRRLSGWLSDHDRERLARFMAGKVLDAARPLPVFVACDDDDVATWAEQRHAHVLWGPGLGLNGAIDHGVDTMAGKGIDHVVISHGDLPLATGLQRLVAPEALVIVPDRRRDGTNVLSRPTGIRFDAEYGAASFSRHLTQALGIGIRVSVCRDRALSLDVDTVTDCRHPEVARILRQIGTTALTPRQPDRR